MIKENIGTLKKLRKSNKLTCPARKYNFVYPTWYISGRISNCRRMATDMLKGSLDSWTCGRRTPYLNNHICISYKASKREIQQQRKEHIIHLLENSWCVILVGYPDLEILAMSRRPEHLSCSKTRSLLYMPGTCLLFGFMQQTKCGAVLSNCCINLNNRSCKILIKATLGISYSIRIQIVILSKEIYKKIYQHI